MVQSEEELARDLEAAKMPYKVGSFPRAVQALGAVITKLEAKPETEQMTEMLSDAYFHLGLTYFALNDRDSAKESFGEVLKLDPGYPIDTNQYAPRIVTLFEEAKSEVAVAPPVAERTDEDEDAAAGPPAQAHESEGGSKLPLILGVAGVGAAAGVGILAAGGSDPTGSTTSAMGPMTSISTPTPTPSATPTSLNACFDVTPDVATVGTQVRLDANCSSPASAISTYSWELGDGRTREETTPVIFPVYRDAGNFTARLTVMGANATASTTERDLTVALAGTAGSPGSPSPSPGSPSPSPGPTVCTTVQVQASQRWPNTNVQVITGQTIAITAGGVVNYDTDGGTATPDGSGTGPGSSANVLPGAPRRGLVCGAGTSVPAVKVFIGSGNTFTATATGTVFCTINEVDVFPDAYQDNSGAWTVQICR